LFVLWGEEERRGNERGMTGYGIVRKRRSKDCSDEFRKLS